MVLLFLTCFFTSSNGTPLQNSFQVFRINLENERELDILKSLYENAHDYSLDFWKPPTKAGTFSDLMVPWKMTSNITALLTTNNITYNVIISDVSQLMREEEISIKRKNYSFGTELGSFFRRFNDESSKNKAKYNFEEYGSYTQMTDWMKKIQIHYPSFTKVFQIGKTHEGRYIEGIKIGNSINDTKKRAVWIDGGIHAREWAAMHTALYFINELVSNYGSDPTISKYVDSINFYIVPCLNPDGYEFSFSATDNPMQYETGSNSNPCSYNYQGRKPFSEPESSALRDMLLSPELKGKTDAYITMHTYAQFWMYPWGNRPDSYTEDFAELKTVAEEAAEALKSSYGTKYKTGTGADLLYSASGASGDWAKDTAKVKYAYVLELRPASALNGFILNKNELLPTAKETWIGVKVVIDAVLRLNGLQQKVT
uniref:Zinc carboxypeptidase A 1 n=1 Tax=Plectus sambesii TaxID=2011161 RepID=A0A914VHM2_9BILA